MHPEREKWATETNAEAGAAAGCGKVGRQSNHNATQACPTAPVAGAARWACQVPLPACFPMPQADRNLYKALSVF